MYKYVKDLLWAGQEDMCSFKLLSGVYCDSYFIHLFVHLSIHIDVQAKQFST